MYNFKRCFILIYLLLLLSPGFAQDLIPSHYVFSRDALNPGSFTQCNDVNVFLLHNNQFTGFEQSPSTQIADISVDLNHLKVGLLVINDVIGYQQTQNVKVRFAKQFGLSDKGFFSLGLSAGAIHTLMEATKMTFEYDDDPLSYSDYSETKLDFDFGAEFQSEKLVVGLSITHLGKEFSNPDIEGPVAHYYAYAQYKLCTNNAFCFYPNVLTRLWNGTVYGELGVQTFFKNKLWIGTSYSVNHNLAFNAGARVTKKILCGYAYRTNMNAENLSVGTYNTHEIIFNYAINWEKGNMKSVRFID